VDSGMLFTMTWTRYETEMRTFIRIWKHSYSRDVWLLLTSYSMF